MSFDDHQILLVAICSHPDTRLLTTTGSVAFKNTDPSNVDLLVKLNTVVSFR